MSAAPATTYDIFDAMWLRHIGHVASNRLGEMKNNPAFKIFVDVINDGTVSPWHGGNSAPHEYYLPDIDMETLAWGVTKSLLTLWRHP